MEELSAKDFNDILEALKTKITEKPKSLRSEHKVYRKEISTKQYDFGRCELDKNYFSIYYIKLDKAVNSILLEHCNNILKIINVK